MRYLAVIVLLLGLWGCTDSRVACLEQTDTEAGEAACAELFNADNTEYNRCVDAGGSWIEDGTDSSCYAAGTPLPGPDYGGDIVAVAAFIMIGAIIIAFIRNL